MNGPSHLIKMLESLRGASVKRQAKRLLAEEKAREERRTRELLLREQKEISEAVSKALQKSHTFRKATKNFSDLKLVDPTTNGSAVERMDKMREALSTAYSKLPIDSPLREKVSQEIRALSDVRKNARARLGVLELEEAKLRANGIISQVLSGTITMDEARKRINAERLGLHEIKSDKRKMAGVYGDISKMQEAFEKAFLELEKIKERQMDRLAREAKFQRGFDERNNESILSLESRLKSNRITKKDAIILVEKKMKEALNESRDSKSEFRKNMYQSAYNSWAKKLQELRKN